MSAVRIAQVVLAAAAALLAPACRGEHEEARRTEEFDATPRRHVFEPPPGEMRAVPPHAIRSEGVGPYLLGASLQEILGLLPHGPRVELLQIEGLLDYSLVRIEDDAIAIGVERFEGVTFVAVLDPEIASTEQGVGVGTTVSELLEALGPLEEVPYRARDPRVLDFPELPNTQFVVEDEEVIAVIVRDGRAPDSPEEEDGSLACGEAARWEAAPDATLARAAGIAAGDVRSMRTAVGCFGGAERARLLVTAGDRLAVLGGEPDEPRRIGAALIEDLVYAAPLDANGDGRHEVAAVASRRLTDELKTEIALLEPAEGRMPIVGRHVPYTASSRSATWVGAELADTELLVEVRADRGALDVGGLYLHREGRETRIVAPLRGRAWAPSIAPRAGGSGANGEDASPRAGAGDAGAGPAGGDAGGAPGPGDAGS